MQQIMFFLACLALFILVIVFFINNGELLIGRFRLVKKTKRAGDLREVWVIEQRFFFVWWTWNCAGEYWNGEYDKYDEAKEDYDRLINKTKKQIIECQSK